MKVESRRDVTMLDRLLSRPDWNMPEGVHEALPKMMFGIMTDRLYNMDDDSYTPWRYSDRAKTKAADMLEKFHRSNVQQDASLMNAIKLLASAAAMEEEGNTHVMADAYLEDCSREELAESAAILKNLGILDRLADEAQVQGLVHHPDNGNGNGNGHANGNGNGKHE